MNRFLHMCGIKTRKPWNGLDVRRAFTLVETMVAIGVLLLAIAGPMTLARQSLKVGPVTKGHITAYFLAQDAIEYIKNVRDTNTSTGASWLTGLTPCLDGCIVDTSVSAATIADAIITDSGSCTPLRYDAATNRYGCNPAWAPSAYSRSTTLSMLVADQEALLTTTISWTEQGRPYSFSASQSLFNIGDAIGEGLSNLEPPAISSGGPGGTLTAGTVQTIATVLTNKAATCKWDYVSVDYDLMQNFFDTTGGTNHSTTITGLQDGYSYTIYVRCIDQQGQENLASYPISFSVATPTGGGLVGYWPFDSNANDISGNNRHGALVNGAGITSASKLGIGALALDGADDYVSIPSNTAFQGNQNLTLSVWFKTNLAATAQQVISKSSNSTSKDWQLRILTDGKFSYESEVANSGYFLQSSAGLIQTNTWYHGVAVIDKTNNRLTLYVNGVQVAQDTAFGNNSDGTTQEINVGRLSYSSTPYQFSGSIDDFRIYNYAMTGAQVTSLYNAGISNGGGVITYDASGSGFCTAVNTCTVSGFDLGNGSGNNRLVVVNVGVENGTAPTISSVKFNGVTGTQAIKYDWSNGTPIMTSAQWYFLDANLPSSAGLYNVVVNTSAAVDGLTMSVLSYKNVFQGAPTASAGNGCTACTSAAASLSVPDISSVVVASGVSAQVTDLTGSNGITKRIEVDKGGGGGGAHTHASGDKIVSASGSTSAGFTGVASARMAATAASWKPLTGGSNDTTAPAAVTLSVGSPTANSLTVSWTAPGDDGSTGTASIYDLRRASTAITTATAWSNAAVISGEPAPSVAGTAESMVVTGLSPNTTYCFALKTSDEVPNTSALSTNSPCATTSAGSGSLLAYWTFDTNANDVTGNNHDGTLTNGAVISTTNPKVGAGSLQLDGTNDYVNTIDVDEINGASKATVAFWVKFSSTGSTFRHLISKFVSSPIDFTIAMDNTNLNVDLGNGSGDSYSQWTYGSNLSINTWHHIAVVFDGTQTGDANRLKMYVDNTQRTLTFPNAGTQPIPAVIHGSLSSAPFRIGSREGTSGYFAGNIDDVRIYNYALSASEISTLYSGGGSSDTTAPAAVSNLAVTDRTTTSAKLTWTAPGDDGSTGTATSYDVRYSTAAITSGNWGSATQATGEPTPGAAGTAQNMTVTGLTAGTTYYFAIKTSDEVPNTSAVSNSPSGSTIPTSNLVGFWPFDTNANDSSGNANNGTLNGNAAVSTSLKKVGAGSLTLDGNGDFVTIGDPASGVLDLGGGNYTISFWSYKPSWTGGGTAERIISKESNSNNKEYSINIDDASGQAVRLEMEDAGNNAGVTTTGTNTIQLSTWQHILVTFTASTKAVGIYVNGVAKPISGSIPALPTVFTGSLYFGKIGYGTSLQYFTGNLDQIRFYNRVLSAAEIDALYHEAP